jgi:hypothetical protein
MQRNGRDRCVLRLEAGAAVTILFTLVATVLTSGRLAEVIIIAVIVCIAVATVVWSEVRSR